MVSQKKKFHLYKRYKLLPLKKLLWNKNTRRSLSLNNKLCGEIVSNTLNFIVTHVHACKIALRTAWIILDVFDSFRWRAPSGYRAYIRNLHPNHNQHWTKLSAQRLPLQARGPAEGMETALVRPGRHKTPGIGWSGDHSYSLLPDLTGILILF